MCNLTENDLLNSYLVDNAKYPDFLSNLPRGIYVLNIPDYLQNRLFKITIISKIDTYLINKAIVYDAYLDPNRNNSILYSYDRSINSKPDIIIKLFTKLVNCHTDDGNIYSFVFDHKRLPKDDDEFRIYIEEKTLEQI